MGYQLDWSILWTYRELLFSGLVVTCELFLFSAFGALALGTLIGVARTGAWITSRLISGTYVEVNRNTPLIVKVCFLYFVVGISPFNAAILALVIHQSAYIAEDVRAAIQSVPDGQIEAATSSGLSRWRIVYHVILPQAWTIVLPAIVVELIEILKNSSIAMVITVEELTFMSQQIDAITFRGFEVATAVTILYLCLAWLISRLSALYRAAVPASRLFVPTDRVHYPTA